jgi:hypothetical protein
MHDRDRVVHIDIPGRGLFKAVSTPTMYLSVICGGSFGDSEVDKFGDEKVKMGG